MHAEGALTYDALLFIPKRPPYDFYNKDYEKGLALYSSNVLIMEKCGDLLPDYFSFVKGVVDSQDLSLNISRETLQQNSQLRAIASKLEKKIKSELEKFLKNDRDGYEKFFKGFGQFGIRYLHSYGMKKDVLADLLLFYSAKQQKMVTLAEYVEAMPEDQKSIFFATGEAIDRLAKRPIVNTVLSKGFDVLLCPQDVDEFCFMSMSEYNENGSRMSPAATWALKPRTKRAQLRQLRRKTRACSPKCRRHSMARLSALPFPARLTDTLHA